MSSVFEDDKASFSVTDNYDDWVMNIDDLFKDSEFPPVYLDFFKKSELFMIAPVALLNNVAILARSRKVDINELETIMNDINVIPYVCYMMDDSYVLRSYTKGDEDK